MSICLLKKIEGIVDVKISTDRGSASSLTYGPVTVAFNKDFADIRALNVTPVSTGGERLYCVVDFVDIANPTDFSVEIWNEAGTSRLAKNFYWVASGVLNK